MGAWPLSGSHLLYNTHTRSETICSLLKSGSSSLSLALFRLKTGDPRVASYTKYIELRCRVVLGRRRRPSTTRHRNSIEKTPRAPLAQRDPKSVREKTAGQ